MADKMVTALFNTLMGMGTVFLVLIFISLVIMLFKYIPAFQVRLENRKKRKKEESRQLLSQRPAPKRPALVIDEETRGQAHKEEENLIHDGELVAVITAAILASMGGPVSKDKLVVRSIKRVQTKNRR